MCVLLVLLLALLIRWLLRTKAAMPRMVKYVLASVAVHALVFLLTMNILIETGVVELEEVAPTLAVKVRAVEKALGFEITPAGREIAIAERESETAVQRRVIEEIKQAERSVLRPDTSAKKSVLEAKRLEQMPEMAKKQPEPLKKTVQQAQIRERLELEEKFGQNTRPRQVERALASAPAAAPETGEARPTAEAKPEAIRARERMAVHLPTPTARPGHVQERVVPRKVARVPMENIGERLAVTTRAVRERTEQGIPESALKLEKASAASAHRRASINLAPDATGPAAAAPDRVQREVKTGLAAVTAEHAKQAMQAVEEPAAERPNVAVKAAGPATPAGVEPSEVTVSVPGEAASGEERLPASVSTASARPSAASVPAMDIPMGESEAGPAAVSTDGVAKVDIAPEVAVSGERVRPAMKSETRATGEQPARPQSVARMVGVAAPVRAKRVWGPGRPGIARAADTAPRGIGSAEEVVLAGVTGERAKQVLAAEEEPTLGAASVSVKKVSTRRESSGPSRVEVSAHAEVATPEQERRAVALAMSRGEAEPASTPSSVPVTVKPIGTAPVRVRGGAPSARGQIAPDAPMPAEHAHVEMKVAERTLSAPAPATHTVGRMEVAEAPARRLSSSVQRSTPMVGGPRVGVAPAEAVRTGGRPALVSGPASAEKSVIERVEENVPSEIRANEVKKSSDSRVVETARSLETPGPGLAAAEERMDLRAQSVSAVPRDVPLEPKSIDLKPTAHTGTSGSDFSFSTGKKPSGGVTGITLGLAKYSGGDWNCSPTAMMFLSHEIGERTGMSLEVGHRAVDIASPEIMNVPFVYMTGHKDFVFSDSELRSLRKYLEGGGYLWVDDSTHFNDDAFDRAFRRELARVLPGKTLTRLDMSFPAFRTGYDLTKGYKGYAIPPGDKYRLDYIEGVRVADRVAVVYTRNDYGDGLNIDPNTHPLMPSLTDLSPAEMQEGSVRMGVNMVLYFLSAGGKMKTAARLDEARDIAAPAAPEGEARVIDGLDAAQDWTHEAWGDAATAVSTGEHLEIEFQLGSNKKVAFSKGFDGTVRLTASDSLVVDVENCLQCGAQLAIGLVVGGVYHETPPFYLKPGRNTAFFRMSAKTFKTEETEWQYRASPGVPMVVDRLTVLIYSPAPGRIVLDNLMAVTEE